MGYTKHAAEKSLLMTGNKGVDPALNWAMDNADQPDFNEQLFI